MENWSFERCLACSGTGKVNNQLCLLCDGFGVYEFIVDDNYRATQILMGSEKETDSKIIELCNQRLAEITPDNIEFVLTALENGLVYSTPEEETAFNDLHQAGTEQYSWAWLNANRFAKELGTLNNIDCVKFRYALTKLAWNWLS